MKGLNRIAIGVGLLLALGMTAQAQAPAAGGGGGARQGRQGGRGGGVSLATMDVKAIGAVVTLTDDQKTKITKIQEDTKAAVTAAAGDQTATRAARTKGTTDITAVLTTDQQATWKDRSAAVGMLVQSRAVPVSVLADVKLTDAQWTKIKDAATATNEKIQALAQADRRTGRAPLLAEFKTTVEGFLTADQKAIIEKAPKPAAPAV